MVCWFEWFVVVLDGVYVWICDEDGFLWFGRFDGVWWYDMWVVVYEVDFVYVRFCYWLVDFVLLYDVFGVVRVVFV